MPDMFPDTSHRRKGAQRGFILMTSYFLLSVVSIFSLALFSRSTSFFQATERNQNKIIAFNMAEAAVDLAIARLQQDPTYPGSDGYVSLATPQVQGGYELAITTPPDNPNVREITATGFAPGNDVSLRGYETRTIVTYVQLDGSHPFDFAIFAKEDIHMSGNAVVDSYDSRNGPYDPLNAGQNGDIGTNSLDDDDVKLSGNVTVKGDAVVGPGGDPNEVISISGNSQITGTQSAATSERGYPTETTTLPSLGDLSVSGNSTYTLPGGTYHFDSIKVTGNAQIQALGPVVIYVSGSVELAGNGIATQGNLPPNMLIYVTNGSDVKISGNANYYGGIYAPDSEVKNTGNGQIFGAIVAEDYHQTGNGKVHFDEAMKEVGGSTGQGISVLSWRETNTTLGG